MRNMKRTLSLLVCLTMALSFVIVAAPAALGAEVPLADVPASDATAKQYADAYGYEIPSSPTAHVVKSADDKIWIDLDTETIFWNSEEEVANPTGASKVIPTMISIDGGTSWKAMKFSIAQKADKAKANAAFAKMLDKGGSFMLTTDIDKTTKQPQEQVLKEDNTVQTYAATTYTFGTTLNARPKLAGFKPNYAPESLVTINANSLAGDADGVYGNGFWLPEQAKDANQTAAGLDIVYSKDGKNPVMDGAWGKVPSGGIAVLDYTDKPSKLTYIIRVAPTGDTPASKAKKIKVSTTTKAPNLKVDYKKNLIKFKANMIAGQIVEYAVANDKAIMTEAAKFTQTANTVATTKESDWCKPGLSITVESHVQDAGVRIVNTAKKPASKIQCIRIAKAAEMSYSEAYKAFTISKGKAKVAKGYELIADLTGAKFDKSSTSGFIRQKNAAKFNAKTNVTTNEPASKPIAFTYESGVYDVAKNKEGIIDVKLTLPTADADTGKYGLSAKEILVKNEAVQKIEAQDKLASGTTVASFTLLQDSEFSLDTDLSKLEIVAAGITEIPVTKLELVKNVSAIDVKTKEDIVPTKTLDGTIIVSLKSKATTGDDAYTVYSEKAKTAIKVTVKEALPDAAAATISGTAKFGQTLTAALTGATNPGTLTYQWFNGATAIEDATDQTYTLVAEDIGDDITVKITAANYTGSKTSTAVTVAKADGPDAPTLVEAVPQAGEIRVEGSALAIAFTAGAGLTITDYQFSTDNGANWADAAATVTRAADTYTVIVRAKETGTHAAGSEAKLEGVVVSAS